MDAKQQMAREGKGLKLPPIPSLGFPIGITQTQI